MFGIDISGFACWLCVCPCSTQLNQKSHMANISSWLSTRGLSRVRSLIVLLVSVVLVFLGALIVTFVIRVGLSILRAEERINEVTTELHSLRSRIDSIHSTKVEEPLRPPKEPPRPPTEACVTAQVKFVQGVVAASGRNAKPFGWEHATYHSFFRALPTVTKRQPDIWSDGEGDGCAIFDVGANRARKLTGIIHAVQQAQDNRTADDLECSIYAYEPVPPTYKLAQERIDARFSEVTRKRVHLLNKAVGDQVGTIRFGWNGAGDLGASISNTAGFSNSGMVPITTVDEEIENVAGGRRVAMLKIDVEGHEAQTLRGAQRSLKAKRIDSVVWERHPNWKRTLKLPPLINEVNKVAAFGYHVYLQEQNTTVRLDGAYWHPTLESSKFKVDAVAALANSKLDRLMGSRLLPPCQALAGLNSPQHLSA